MSTLTPNFNLIQPEVTDPFADFRDWYNQTLAIIDANLGGGGSKHTIIDENGQTLPNRTFLEFTGGVQVTDDAQNNKTVVDITGGGGGSSTLAGLTDVNLTSPTNGQVLAYDNTSHKWINANSSGGSCSYSTTEQVIGTWTDGKPLYQISIIYTSGITIGSYGHVTLPADSVVRDYFGVIYRNNYKSVDKFNGYINNGDIFCSIRSGNLEYYISNIFSGIEELDFTVQYTKTTD